MTTIDELLGNNPIGDDKVTYTGLGQEELTEIHSAVNQRVDLQHGPYDILFTVRDDNAAGISYQITGKRIEIEESGRAPATQFARINVAAQLLGEQELLNGGASPSEARKGRSQYAQDPDFDCNH